MTHIPFDEGTHALLTLPESHGRNLALTVLYVPRSHGSLTLTVLFVPCLQIIKPQAGTRALLSCRTLLGLREEDNSFQNHLYQFSRTRRQL